MLGFDESFDANGAGGWEEASFVSSQAAPDAHLTDKVPLPCTVVNLAELGEGIERITIGNSSFTTIHVVGQVKKSVVMDGGQSIEYTISDYHDQSREFLIVHYKGVSGDTDTSDLMVEGTDVSVVGKLRSFNDRLCIVAFDVRELENQKEIDVFHLEAKLARLYYSQNIPELAAAGNLSKYNTTIIRGADTGSPAASNAWSNNLMPKISQAAETCNRQTFDDCRGLSGQKAEIFGFLRKHGDSMLGASVQEIRLGIPKSLFKKATFQADMEYLASEGLIYATSDDDHYAANS